MTKNPLNPKKMAKTFRLNKGRWLQIENVLEDRVNTQGPDSWADSAVQIRLKAKNNFRKFAQS